MARAEARSVLPRPLLALALLALVLPAAADHAPEGATVAGSGAKSEDGLSYGDCVHVALDHDGHLPIQVWLEGDGADWDLVWTDSDGNVRDADDDGSVEGEFSEGDEIGNPPAWARGAHLCLWSSTSTDVTSWLIDDVEPRVEPVPRAGDAAFRLVKNFHGGWGDFCLAYVACVDRGETAGWRRHFLPDLP